MTLLPTLAFSLSRPNCARAVPLPDTSHRKCLANSLIPRASHLGARRAPNLVLQAFRMRDFLLSLTHAVRVLRKNPGFTISALAVLTLGIGANTAIFSVVNTVLLRPLPFPDSQSVVTIYHVPPPAAFPGIKRFAVSAANYFDWQKQNHVFEAMSVWGGRGLRITGGERAQLMVVTISDADFFKVLGTSPEAGRVFTQEECKPGPESVIVLSDAYARSHFSSPAAAIGQQIRTATRPYKVIGVMPAELNVKAWFPASTEGWIPMPWTEEERAKRGNHSWNVAARLRPGVTVAQAQSAMNVISDRLARDYPEEDKGWGAIVTQLRDNLVGDVRPALLTLLGAVGFVLLIACANTANLVLARTIARRKELAIRAALGASSRQVLRPVFTETMLLAIAGGALGLLVARSGQTLVTKALADQLPRATEVQLDGRVLAFTLIASVLTGIAAALLAGARLLRGDLNDSLKQGLGKSDSYSGGRGTRNALVVSEVALSLMLLVGAGLMIRTLWALRGTDPGFNPDHVLTLRVPVSKSSDQSQRTRLYDDILPQIAAIPGVQSVAAIDNLPMQGGSEQPIAVEGRPAEVFALQRNVSVRVATPNYFGTMGIPMVSGRDFSMADTAGEKAVAVVSRSMANLFWPGENPLGKRFRISFTPKIVREVAGVVEDIRDRGLQILEPVTMLYIPILQSDTNTVSLVVRSSSDPARLAPGITKLLGTIAPELPIRNILTMDEIVATTLSQQRY